MNRPQRGSSLWDARWAVFAVLLFSGCSRPEAQPLPVTLGLGDNVAEAEGLDWPLEGEMPNQYHALEEPRTLRGEARRPSFPGRRA